MKDLMNPIKAELLAPAGDMESLRTALKYGADAIYCGGPFMQLRAASAGFTMESLAEAAGLVHGAGAASETAVSAAGGRKLYVTVNSFAWSDEISKLGPYARQLHDIGVDALIVSDLGAVAEIKEKCPDIAVHVSTQANCMNYRAAEVYYNMGASRVVLARELSIEKIKELRALAPAGLELEAFVHGAMCMAYSGRCLISSFLTGRSGNRGQCTQSCRWDYYLMEQKRPGEYFPLEEGPQGTAILSSKEMCMIDHLRELADAGAVSFKCEGRMRTPFYIGTVANAYRMALDGFPDTAALRAELETISHRPYCTGFYLGDPESIATGGSDYIRNYIFVATALEASSGGKLRIETRNPFSVGDELEVLTPGSTGRAFRLESIVDAEGTAIDRSPTPMRVMTINAPDGIQPGDIIRRKGDCRCS